MHPNIGRVSGCAASRASSTKGWVGGLCFFAEKIASPAGIAGARRGVVVFMRSRAPVGHVPDEEGPHLGDELRRLPRLAHRLHEVAERVQILADEADDELVVLGVDAMARESNVV